MPEPPPHVQRAIQDLDRKLAEHKSRMQKLRQEHQREIEKREEERQEAPLWVPVLMLMVLIGLIGAGIFFERRQKRRRQVVASQARTIYFLILEEKDPEEIWAALTKLELTKKDVPAFRLGLTAAMLSVPLPWYRPDVPNLVQEIHQYLDQLG